MMDRMIPIGREKPRITKVNHYDPLWLRKGIPRVERHYWQSSHYGWVDEETYGKLIKHANFEINANTDGKLHEEIVNEVSDALHGFNSITEFVMRVRRDSENPCIRSYSWFGSKDVVKWNWLDRNIMYHICNLGAWFMTKYFTYYIKDGKPFKPTK